MFYDQVLFKPIVVFLALVMKKVNPVEDFPKKEKRKNFRKVSGTQL